MRLRDDRGGVWRSRWAAIGAAAAVPFLDIVAYRFGLADPEAHYHLPMKCTPWGYSCFRGGA